MADDQTVRRALLAWAKGLKKRAAADPFGDDRVGARFLEKAAGNVAEGLHERYAAAASEPAGTVSE